MKKWILIISILLSQITVCAKEEPENLYAQSAVLMDADSGRVLFEKNGEEQKAMASTTKIMTCILALEEGNLDDVVTFSDNAASQPKVHLGAASGKQFYLRDLLYSLMLESHNDSAVAIAEHIAGSVEAFAERMNQKAEELGCEDTHYVTPNGLDGSDEAGNHVTTAADLARVMSYCISDSPKAEEFLKITQTSNYYFTDIEQKQSYNCTNHNAFLSMMEGAISGKTGYTAKAGYCYVGALERDGRTFVVALLACGWPNHKTYKWSDTRELMEYALENYEYRDVYEEVAISPVFVQDGIPKNENLFGDAYAKLEVENAEEDLQLLLCEEEDVEIKVQVPKVLKAPVKKGEVVGSVTYYLDGEAVKEYSVIATRDIGEKSLKWYFQKVAALYFGM